MKKAARKNLFSWRFVNFLSKWFPFFKLMEEASLDEWDKAKSQLFDFNKTVITVASSAIVLSFSLTKITGNWPKIWLISSYVSFAIVPAKQNVTFGN